MSWNIPWNMCRDFDSHFLTIPFFGTLEMQANWGANMASGRAARDQEQDRKKKLDPYVGLMGKQILSQFSKVFTVGLDMVLTGC